jgi:hypothetical protein
MLLFELVPDVRRFVVGINIPELKDAINKGSQNVNFRLQI